MDSCSSIPDYEKIEIQQIYEQIRASDAMYVQVYTFFGTANVTMLGFGFTFKMAGLVLLGAAMIVLLAFVERLIKKYRYAFFVRGLELEQRYSSEPENALLGHKISTYQLADTAIRRYWLPGAIVLFETFLALLLHYALGWEWF